MKKFFILSLLFFSMTAVAACSPDDAPAAEAEQPATPDTPGGDETPDEPISPSDPNQTKTLVAYFSAQGHTQAVAERIVELLGADIFRIEAADPYAENPYDDSDRIQNESYNDLRPGVADLPTDVDDYDVIFVGSPIWWHNPAMVVCTFLENYDLGGKIIVPFFTYGSTEYLQQSVEKIHEVTPSATHLRTYSGGDVEEWLRTIHIIR